MTLCSISTVAFGGKGVGRVDDLVLFVPFTLPEEIAEVEVYKKKRSFGEAKLIKLVQTNPDRVQPPCQYFSCCGGCQLQHASYPLQLQLKKQFIEDSLRRIGRINYTVPSISPSSIPFAYRRHISLKIKIIDGFLKLCFASVDNASFLPIYSCLLLHSPKDPILPLLQAAMSQIPALPSLVNSTVKVLKTSQNQYIVACSFLESLASESIEMLKKEFSNTSAIAGWIIKAPNQLFEFGATKPSFLVKGLTFAYSPFSFVQNHPEQSAKIYDWILKVNNDSQKILDLYCGIGISSVLLAQASKQIVGIEISPLAIELATLNAKQNNITGAEFFCGSAESLARKMLSSLNPDGLIVNPPRTGVPSIVLQAISEASSVRFLTYISCNPATLARDLAFLLKEGFEIKELQGFDMFPQTTHVETAVFLEREDKKIAATYESK